MSTVVVGRFKNVLRLGAIVVRDFEEVVTGSFVVGLLMHEIFQFGVRSSDLSYLLCRRRGCRCRCFACTLHVSRVITRIGNFIEN